MKKLIITAISIISICIAVNVIIINANAKSEEKLPTGNHTYIVKNFEGKVACFEENAASPFIITDIYVINLPPLDRQMLQEGISVVGAKKLSRVLEDYRS